MIRMNDPQQVRKAIKNLRAEAGISQDGVAGRTDWAISQQQVNRWENGPHLPSVTSLMRLAHALGYDVALVPREDAQPTGTWCNGRSTLVMAICGNQKPHGPHERCERIDCDHWHCEGRA